MRVISLLHMVDFAASVRAASCFHIHRVDGIDIRYQSRGKPNFLYNTFCGFPVLES